MKIDLLDCLPKAPSGHLTLAVIDEKTLLPIRLLMKKNLIMYAGADIMAKALGGFDVSIDYLYLEFTNGSVPSDPLAGSPRNAGISYYTALASPQDYLRIPISTTPILSATGSNYVGNSVTFSGTSAGISQGVNGLPFTNGTSIVYGAALASRYSATASAAQDIVFSRNYFLEAGQPITKLANQQCAAYWAINFY